MGLCPGRPRVSGAVSYPRRFLPQASGDSRGRGSRTPVLTGGRPGAEGGLSAHVRARVPKQSWPASLRHRRPPLTLPRLGSSPPDVLLAKRFNAAPPGSAVGRDSELGGAAREGQRCLWNQPSPTSANQLLSQCPACSFLARILPLFSRSPAGAGLRAGPAGLGLARGETPSLSQSRPASEPPSPAIWLRVASPQWRRSFPDTHREPGPASLGDGASREEPPPPPPRRQTAAGAGGRAANS